MVNTFFKRAGQRQPLVLILDNLHWADRPSLLLLEFLAQELADSRLLVLGTYRDVEVSGRHPMAHTLGMLTRQSLFHRVPLRGLSQEETRNFISGACGFGSPATLARAVHMRTEGNPLFITEVVRLLQRELTEAPVEGRESWDVQVPVSVYEVIGLRLERLSEECYQLLTMAAVVGREFRIDVLERLEEGCTRSRLFALTEEALEARVIEELPDGVGHYRFTHVLVQETLLSQQSRARVATLHGAIGKALEALYAEDLAPHASELAYHFGAAAEVIGHEKLARYSLMAGEQALASYAYEDALSHFQRGLAARGVALEGREPAKDAQVAALLSGLGRARGATADRLQLQQAIDSLRRAFDYYAQAGDVTRAVAVAEYPYFFSAGFPTGMAQLIGRALALVPPDSHQAGRLLPRYGYVLSLEEGEQQGAQEAFSRALAIAHRTWDAGLELRTLAEAAVVDRYQRRFEESLKRACEPSNWPGVSMTCAQR